MRVILKEPRTIAGVWYEAGSVVDLGRDLAGRLILAGKAVAVGAGSTVEASADLEAMTVKELHAYADEHGIDLGGAKKKAEIIEVIRGA